MAHSRIIALVSAAVLQAAAFSAFAATANCPVGGCAGDAKISEDVRTALFHDAQFSGDNGINVQTRDGVVYLSGQVDTDAQRKSAEAVARRVAGVKRVVASLNLRSNGQ
jgi:osmotically-inducible protein OsmY